MTFLELINYVYMLIDEKKKPEYEKIIKAGINYVYKKINREKFNKLVVDLSLNTDVPDLPEFVDPIIMCYFAAWFFYQIDGDDEGRGMAMMNLYNDGIDNVDGTQVEQEVLTDVYSY